MSREMPSPFFSLPRELRDLIYISLLTTDKRHFKCGTQLCTHNASLPHILLISKPFTHEYLETTSKLASLDVTFRPRLDIPELIFHPSIKRGKIPPLPKSVTRVEKVVFELEILDPRAIGQEIWVGEEWVVDVLSHIKEDSKVSCDFVLRTGLCAFEVEREICWSGFWTLMEGLDGLRIWRERTARGGERRLLMEWVEGEGNAGGRFERRVEEKELRRGGENVWLNTVL